VGFCANIAISEQLYSSLGNDQPLYEALTFGIDTYEVDAAREPAHPYAQNSGRAGR
jgi:hypothetical protein